MEIRIVRKNVRKVKIKMLKAGVVRRAGDRWSGERFRGRYGEEKGLVSFNKGGLRRVWVFPSMPQPILTV